VHVEVCPHLHRTVQHIKELGARATVVINPGTPLVSIEPILSDVDMILLMTVNPGFGGQQFIRSMLSKVRQCRRMIDALQAQALLEVDGGVNLDTIDDLVAAGVDVFVAGSAVFKGDNYAANIRGLKARMR
jgi:ribulose-phosphate 3-epimerase